jgi:copper(I)-binding protein
VIWSRRMTARPSRLLVLAIAALIPALAGCEAGTDAPTQQWHNPTDGAGVVHDNISISNVFVLGGPIGSTLSPGQSAGVFFALVNNGSQPDKLVSIMAPRNARSVSLAGGAITLASQRAVLLTGPAPKVVLEDLTRPLRGGGSVILVMNFQNAASVTLDVPVVPRAAYYATLSPPPTPTPTPTAAKSTHHPAAKPSTSPSP